jgi:hypothetical protein
MVYCCGKPATVNKGTENRGKVWGKLAVLPRRKKTFVYAAPLATPFAHGFAVEKISSLSMD